MNALILAAALIGCDGYGQQAIVLQQVQPYVVQQQVVRERVVVKRQRAPFRNALRVITPPFRNRQRVVLRQGSCY